VEVILAIDQGTTNSKALLVDTAGRVVARGTAAVGISSTRPGWVEQDADRIFASVLAAVAAAREGAPDARIAGVALSTQRESVVGWRAGTSEPLGPVLGWQDRRTAAWCAHAVDEESRRLVQRRTGLRVDAMFSAPKMRWLLDHRSPDVPAGDVRLGTVDAWLIWRLTGGRTHACDAGNASRTLLYDIAALDWSADLLDVFGVPAATLPAALASDAGFGTTAGTPLIPDGTPILAVLADSHAALFGHGCTEPGTAKATYGTGSSVMAPLSEMSTEESPVPTTLAWVIAGSPRYAMEGNILSSGATLAWTADLLTGGDVAALIALAESVPDSGGVTLVPAFTGLGAPHWDRGANALIAGLSEASRREHIARAAVDSIGHQIADIVDVIERQAGALRLFRADGGATASAFVVQTQADLLGREVQVGAVTEVSALGAARLAWAGLGHDTAVGGGSTYSPRLAEPERVRRRRQWADEVERTRYRRAPVV
jgi:glycerol kinase